MRGHLCTVRGAKTGAEPAELPGASNDDDRSAPGHRGRLGPVRLCDGTAPGDTRTAAGHGAFAAHGGPARRQRAATRGAGAGPRGPGDGRPVQAPAPHRPGRPAPSGARTTGRPPPARTPHPPTATPGTRTPAPGRAPERVPPGPRRRRPLRPRPQVRRLARRQPGVSDLRTDVRPLTAPADTAGSPPHSTSTGEPRSAAFQVVGRWRGGPQWSPPGVLSSPRRDSRRLIAARTPSP